MVANPATAEIGASTTVTVTLLTSGNSPVNGKSVSLTAAPATTATVSPDSAVTGSDGTASFTVSDSTAESVVVTADDLTDEVTITPTATVVFQSASPSASESTIGASLTSVPADGTTSSTIQVKIVDQFGNALSGKSVSVILTDASGNAEAPPVASEQTPVATNAQGLASFSLVDTSAETVTVGAMDTTDHITLTATVMVTFTAGAPDGTVSTLAAKPQSVPADGTTASTITVTLLDHEASPVGGKTITLTPSTGSSSTVTPASATTTSAGVVTFSVTDTKAEAVTYIATDTTDNVTIGGVVGVTVTFGSPPGPPPVAGSTVLAASPTSAPADGTTAVTVTVMLSDANGIAVPGKTVTLSSPSGTVKVAAVSGGVTDQDGEAMFMVTDTTPESVTFTATDTTDNLPLTGPSVKVTFTAATATTTTTTPSSTTTTVAGGGTTATTASVSSSGTPSTAGAGAVTANSGQLAFTGAPPLLPWLLGLGSLLLVGGSLGRRRVRTRT